MRQTKHHFTTVISLLVCLVLIGFASQLTAQVVFNGSPSWVNFGTATVADATGTTQTLSFTVPSGVTLGRVSALMMGAPNLDFKVTGGDCHAGTTGTSCTVQVTFVPLKPGTRQGAVVLIGQDGTAVATVPIFGTGSGPQITFKPGLITTFAGTGIQGNSGDGGPATSATLDNPMPLASDGFGNIYISSETLRKVTPDGTISTVAGCDGQQYPGGLAVDGAGNIYASQQNSFICKITPDGQASHFAGTGTQGHAGDGGPATSAQISGPGGIAVDVEGNVYFSEWAGYVRKVTTDGTISTVAGRGASDNSGDGGLATDAGIAPLSVSVDSKGDLYIVSWGSVYLIRKVAYDTGIISTFAGGGSNRTQTDGMSAASIGLNYPGHLGIDPLDNVYIPDYGLGEVLRVTPSGAVYFVAGMEGQGGYSGDGGPSDQARLNAPQGITFDPSGNFYIADQWNMAVRKVDQGTSSFTFTSAISTPSASTDLTVWNIGNAPLNIESITPSADFSLGTHTTCAVTGQSLAAYGTCILGIQFTPPNVGTYAGSIAVVDNTLYVDPSTQTITLTGVGKNAQTITFPNPGQLTYGSAPVTLGATSDSGLPVTYKLISGGSYGTLSNGVLTITGIGTVVIEADQAGDAANYMPAAAVQISIVIAKAPQTITFTNPGNQTYSPSGITLSATSTSGTGIPLSGIAITYSVTNGTGVATVSGNVVTVTSAGTITVTANQAGNNYYTAATAVSYTITISKAAQTISFPNPGTLTYMASIPLSATATSGLAVAFTITSGSGSMQFSNYLPPTGTAAGSVTIAANQAGNALYAAATSVSQTFTIVAATTQTITFNNPGPIAYGSGLVQLPATSSCGLTVTVAITAGGTYASYNGFFVTTKAVGGPVTATATQVGNKNCPAATPVAQSFYIVQGAPSITWATPAAITYGTALSATQLKATAAPTGGTFVYTPPSGTVLNAGFQTLSVTYTPTDITDYTTATKTVSLRVNQATPVITWATPAAITYGTALSATQLNATANVPGTIAYSSPTGTVLGAGTKSLTATFTPTDSMNYATVRETVSLVVNQATPVITWVTPAAITYGTALSGTQLNATAAPAGGMFVYSPAAGVVPGTGTQTLSVTYTPTDTTNYTTATGSVSLTVNQAVPVITWATPAAITYGTSLSGAQLNASAAPSGGTFVYSPAAGSVLGAGTQTLSVSYTPMDTTNYTTATGSVSLTVNQATPVITWASPAAITYGTGLSGAQLNASSVTAGTFAYTPAAGTVLSAGTQTLSVTFTPTDSTNYKTATGSVSLTVSQAAPVITWATPAAITYGTALSGTQLNATGSVPGTISYDPALGTVPAAGTQTLSATFTPTDTTDYTAVTKTVSLVVNQAAPAITWATPSAITYGTALSGTQLNASTLVAGTFAYSPAVGVVPGAGTQTLSVTFTPTDSTNYKTATASVSLTVNQANPVITWATPAAITYGTALGGAQLNASATPAGGTFVYNPASGTVPHAGTQTLSVTYTPADTTNYATATASVSLTVNQATPVITWTSPASILYGTGLSGAQLNASSVTAGTFAYSPAAGAVLGVGTQTLSVTFTPTDSTNYTTATASVSLTVNRATPVITWATPAPIPYGTALSGAQLNASSVAAGTFAYSPAAGTVLGVGTQTLSVTFTPTDATDYTTATSSVSLVVTKATPVITWATPAPITYGTALSGTQLNATAAPAGGTFVYSPAAGTVPAVGTQTLSVTYTPTDSTNYTTATGSVSLTVTPDVAATLQSPTAGSTLSGANVNFTWGTGTGATQYQLLLGTTGAGSSDVYNSGNLTGTSITVNGIPVNALTVYARLLSKLYSGWSYVDYTYTEAGTPAAAGMQTPVAGSTLSGASVAFTWNTGVGVSGGYQLLVGTTGAGSSNVYNSGTIAGTTATVTGLPVNALPVYVRLLSKIGGVWQSNDYTYTASGTATAAVMQTPVAGSTLSGASVAFTWNTGVGVTGGYQLLVGTTGAGSSDVYNSGTIAGTTATVTGLPVNALPVYVRLLSKIGATWQSNDYTYTASGTATPAVIQTPASGSTLGTTNVVFTWNTGVGVSGGYQLLLGTTGAGSSNVYNSGIIAATTATVPSIPSGALTIYARLYSKINGVWTPIDNTFIESGTVTRAALTNPAAGSVLGTTNVVFTWNTGVGVNGGYQLQVGTTGLGSSNLLSTGTLAVTTATVPSIPANALPVYVRLFSKINGVWSYFDYMFTESGTPAQAVLLTPAPGLGTTLGTSSVKFTWSTGVGVTAYQFLVGTTGAGSSNLYSSGSTASTTATVATVPSGGGKVYVRLYSQIAGVWQYTDYLYTEQ